MGKTAAVRARLSEQWDLDMGRGIHAGSRPFALYGGEAAAGTAVAQNLRQGTENDDDEPQRPHAPHHSDDDKVPVQSFLDDLDRKLQLRKVMGKPDNKFTGPGEEQDDDDQGKKDEIAGADQLYHQPEQFTKEETNYRYSGRKDKMCGVCKFFVDPASCRLVAGLIRPVDVCDKFEPRRADLTTADRTVRARVAEESDADADNVDTWPGAGMRGDQNTPVMVPPGDAEAEQRILVSEHRDGCPVVRATLAEQLDDDGDDEFGLDECPDDARDLMGNCPGDPDYDDSTAGMFTGEAGTYDPVGRKMLYGGDEEHEGALVHFEPHKPHKGERDHPLHRARREHEGPPPNYPGSQGINIGGQGKLVRGYSLTKPTMARMALIHSSEQQRSWIDGEAEQVSVARGKKSGVSVAGGVRKTIQPIAGSKDHSRVAIVNGKSIKVHKGREAGMGRRGEEGAIVHFEPGKPHEEVSPPGWGGTVKAMKKYMTAAAMAEIGEAMRGDMARSRSMAPREGEGLEQKKRITNPWALAWWMRKKGFTPHKPDVGEGEQYEQYEGRRRREAGGSTDRFSKPSPSGVKVEKGKTTSVQVRKGRASGVKVVRSRLAG